MKKLLLIAGIALFGQNLSAFPYRFTRLIKTDEAGKIEKTVDLIYDRHKKIYRYGKLSKQEVPLKTEMFYRWIRLSPSEQELVKVLGDMADHWQEKIDLICEWSQYSKNKEYKLSFLSYMTQRFEEDFAVEKNKKIRFVFGDTYRNVDNSDFGGLYMGDEIESLRNQKMSGLILYLNSMIISIKNDLNNIKPALSLEIDKKLQAYVDAFEKAISDFVKKFGLTDKLISEKSVEAWIKSLREGGRLIGGKLVSNRYLDFRGDWQNIILEVMNLEIVLRIFGSDAKHLIVYAGGNHCEEVLKILTKDFEFKIIIDIGDSGSQKNITQLDVSAWNYLRETPEESVKKASYINVMPARMWTEDIITNIFSQALDDPSSGLQQLEKLLDVAKTAYVDLVNAQEEDRSTILHKAVQKDVLPLIDLLLKYGAETNIADKEGNTPLFYAKSTEAVQKLLAHDARIDIRNDEGKTPLHRALRKNRTGVVEELLKNGADVKIADADGNTPLHYAQSAKIASKLLEYGALIDARNKWKRTPLHEAIINERRSVVGELLENRADPNEKFEYRGREYFPYDFTESRTIKKSLEKYGAKSRGGQMPAMPEEYIQAKAIKGLVGEQD